MDPLASIILALRPRAAGVKLITGKGAWGARYAAVESAGFGLGLTGACWLEVSQCEAVRVGEGDFVLMPPNPGFAIYTDAAVPRRELDARSSAGLTKLRHGDPDGAPSFRMIGGYFQCEPANADLIASLLPALVHIKREHGAAHRLHRLIALIAEEALGERPARDLIVERLIETLLLEALRCRAGDVGALAQPGLLEGLADPQLARALRRIHAQPAAPWTVAALARECGLSRSTFSDRFLNKVGLAPMEYVMRWRMALAKDMLRRGNPPLETVAAAIGYESASAFSTAFRREVGCPPSQFARVTAGGGDRIATRLLDPRPVPPVLDNGRSAALRHSHGRGTGSLHSGHKLPIVQGAARALTRQARRQSPLLFTGNPRGAQSAVHECWRCAALIQPMDLMVVAKQPVHRDPARLGATMKNDCKREAQ